MTDSVKQFDSTSGQHQVSQGKRWQAESKEFFDDRMRRNLHFFRQAALKP